MSHAVFIKNSILSNIVEKLHQTAEKMRKLMNKNWYDNVAIVAFLCLFIFPVGLFALWKNKEISLTWKYFVSAFFGILIIATIVRKVDENNQQERQQQIAANTYQSLKKPDVPVVLYSEEETKNYVLEIEKRLNKIDEPVSKAVKQFKQFTRYLANGQTSIVEAYQAAKVAKETTDNASTRISNISLSERLPDTVKSMLRKALSSATTANYMRMTAYEAIMEYYDSGKPSYMNTFYEKIDGANNFVVVAAIALMEAKEYVGISSKQGAGKN